MGIPKLSIYGDSSVIINWEKGSASLSPPELLHQCRDTRKLCSCFLELTFCHIYREFIQHVDSLSKKALSLAPGSGNYSEYFDGLLTSFDCFEPGAGAYTPYSYSTFLSFSLERTLLDYSYMIFDSRQIWYE